MKRCECGCTTFNAPYEVVADYRFDGEFKAFELIGICSYPDHERCGSVVCEDCGAEYENEEDIPDAEETGSKS